MDEGVVKSPVCRFRSRSEHLLDAKGRLNIATRFRESLRCLGEERLMLTPWRNCIRAYSLPEWEELEMSLTAPGPKSPETVKLVRYMIGGAEECVLDKQGRILLPATLREDCRIKKDVVVSGMIAYFEIWDKEVWAAESKPTVDDFHNFEQVLLETGRF
ncbi:MAG TPA: division/cell wall cluster transcriptional repressor MraZ [Desulfobulbaceae bacterium]|nr:MAG: division/cell wall cluster transcriptional repressor MraZ [Deltaproteobacteria bacterium RIFOXYD12_FULL_53_23]HCC54499.1 division/cell wall cluster transcriptional repressor MraZ [Desulfobulbaceae bacterium]